MMEYKERFQELFRGFKEDVSDLNGETLMATSAIPAGYKVHTFTDNPWVISAGLCVIAAGGVYKYLKSRNSDTDDLEYSDSEPIL